MVDELRVVRPRERNFDVVTGGGRGPTMASNGSESASGDERRPEEEQSLKRDDVRLWPRCLRPGDGLVDRLGR